MEYRVIRHKPSEDELEHGFFGLGGGTKKAGMQKGAQKENHLYLARQWVKDKWRYAYTQAELRAMQGYQKAKQTGNKAATAVKNARNYHENVDKQEKMGASLRKAGERMIDSATRTLVNNNSLNGSDRDRRRFESAINERDAGYDKENSGSRMERKAQYDQNSLKYKASKALDTALDYADDKANKAKNVAEKALSDAGDAVRSGKEKAAAAINKAAETTVNAAKGVAKAGKDLVENVGEKTKEFRDYHEKADDQSQRAKEQQHAAMVQAWEAKDALDRGGTTSNRYSAKTVPADNIIEIKDGKVLEGDEKKWKKIIAEPGEEVSARAAKAHAHGNLREANDTIESLNKNGIKYRSSKAFDKALDTIEDKTNKAKNVAEKALSDAGDAVRSGKEKAANAINKAAETTVNAAKGAAKAGKDFLENPGQKINEFREYAGKTDEKVNRYAEKRAHDRDIANDRENRAEEERSKANDALWKGKPGFMDEVKEHSGRMEQIQDAWKAGYDNRINDYFSEQQAKEDQGSAKYKASKALDSVLDKAEAAGKAISDKTTKAKDSLNNFVESVNEYIDDKKITAEHKSNLRSAKSQYGTDSPQYKAAQAQVDYDKVLDDFVKVRDKYGVDSDEFKSVVDREKQARTALQTAQKAAAEEPKENVKVNRREYNGTSQKAQNPGNTSKEYQEESAYNSGKSAQREYNGTSQKAQNPGNTSKEYQEESAYNSGKSTPKQEKNYKQNSGTPTAQRSGISDEYWETVAYNTRTNDGGRNATYERNNNYRQLSNQANRLGRATDRATDAVAEAREKYGEDSKQYKDAVKEEQEAFAELREVERQLKRLNQR